MTEQGATELIRILIVDDHTIVRDGLQALISAEPGMQVIGVGSDGVEAVEKARALDPDVILLDLLCLAKTVCRRPLRSKRIILLPVY